MDELSALPSKIIFDRKFRINVKNIIAIVDISVGSCDLTYETEKKIVNLVNARAG